MKIFIIILLSFGTFCGHTATNEKYDTASFYSVNDVIADAIKAGDATKLASYFAQTIQLSVPGKKDVFSKTQAGVIMQDFFKKYPPSSFTINSEGKTSGSNFYVLGSYVSGDVVFKVYYVMQNIENKITLHILKFEIQ